MPPSPRPRDVNRSQYAILGALTLGPMSGYDLRRFFEENLGFFWSESYGQIYPILRTLEAEGLVVPDADASGRRRPYRITDAGRAQLRDWLQHPAAIEVGRIEILLKLFFVGQAPAGTAEAHLARFRAMHEARLQVYAAVAHRLATELADEADVRYWRVTLAYGRRFSEAMVAWCDEALQVLAGGGPGGSPDGVARTAADRERAAAATRRSGQAMAAPTRPPAR